MSENKGPGTGQFDLKTTDIEAVESHYKRLINHHIHRSRLPTLYGWTNRVLLSLTAKMGKSPLEINQVAEDLDIPVRTLQNHLSQEGTSFSLIRDRLRFHYGVEFLIHGKRVEEIFPLLDFNDRTGFINAFKRWTGLPPSHFRKFYNVYVKDKA